MCHQKWLLAFGGSLMAGPAPSFFILRSLQFLLLCLVSLSVFNWSIVDLKYYVSGVQNTDSRIIYTLCGLQFYFKMLTASLRRRLFQNKDSSLVPGSSLCFIVSWQLFLCERTIGGSLFRNASRYIDFFNQVISFLASMEAFAVKHCHVIN